MDCGARRSYQKALLLTVIFVAFFVVFLVGFFIVLLGWECLGERWFVCLHGSWFCRWHRSRAGRGLFAGHKAIRRIGISGIGLIMLFMIRYASRSAVTVMLREMTIIACHHVMQFFMTPEYVITMVAVGVEPAIAAAMFIDSPDICVPADDHDIRIGDVHDVYVIGHCDIGLFDVQRRRRRSKYTDDGRIDHSGIKNRLALLVGGATGHCKDTQDKSQGFYNASNVFQIVLQHYTST